MAGMPGYPGAGGGGQPQQRPPGMAGMAGYPGAGGSGGQQQQPPGMAGMAGYPGSGGGAAGGAGGRQQPPGMAGGPGGSNANKEPDYSNPTAAAETFLNALTKKDPALIAEATAIRAQYEAKDTKMQDFWKQAKAESLAQEDLDKLIRTFEGMKVVNNNQRKSTAMVGVTVGKTEENNYYTRTLYLRHEKDGWKVLDFSSLHNQKTGPRQLRAGNNNNGGGGYNGGR
jgi:hypothetical protein